MRVLSVVLTIGVTGTVALMAGESVQAQESPAEVLQEVMQALDRGDWSVAADRTHPVRLQQLRDLELSFLLTWAEHRHELDRTQDRDIQTWGFGSDGTVLPEKLAAFGAVRLEPFTAHQRSRNSPL